MRGIVIVMLEILCWVLFFLIIAGSVFASGELVPQWAALAGMDPPDTLVSMVIGGVGGLLTSIIMFGTVFAILDIRANSKRTAELLEDLKERRAAAGQRLRD